MRERHFEQAMALLKLVEEKRVKTMAVRAKVPHRGEYWAATLDPADIPDDEASVYVAMGRDDQAEPLLMDSLRQLDGATNRQMKRTLSNLAALKIRTGRQAEAKDFATRAGAIKLAEERPMTDPLATTLGFAE